MTEPLVTVVIPCYNYADQVSRAIRSVQSQNLSNFECFVVDDGSSDSSVINIRKAIAGDSRFKLVKQTNSGVAYARNTGVFLGTAPFVCCLDADDELDPRFLEVCVKELQKDASLGIAYTGLLAITPDGKEALSRWPGQPDYDAAVDGQNQIPTCNVARRDVWERLFGQRQRYAPEGAGEEDAELWLRAQSIGFRAKKVTDAGLFRYSWLSGRVSGAKEHKMTDYRAWLPYTDDKRHPFSSLATPVRHSHPVRQYDEPVVSVVIPVGPGHLDTLVDALDSLDAQSFRKWEAIVVFDTEIPYTYMRNFALAFPHVKALTTGLRDKDEKFHSLGAGAARNLGARNAKGYFLLFLDSDDWLSPNAIEHMMTAWESSDDSVIYSDYYGHAYIDEKTASSIGDRLLSYDPDSGKAILAYQSANYNCEIAVKQPKIMPDGNMYIWNLITSLVPRHYHDQIGGFDEDMESWEDWDYWLRMARNGICFTRVPEKLVVYRFYSGNRRDRGVQIGKNLIQYLEGKYKRIKDMGCGCRKEKTVAPTMPQTQSGYPASSQVVPQSARSLTIMSDEDFVLVHYNHPNRGEHSVFGAATGKDYGRRSGGERLLVHKADIAAFPHIFIPVEQKQLPPNPVVKIQRDTPPPPSPPVSNDKPEKAPAHELSVSEPEEQDVANEQYDFQLIPGISSSIATQLNARGVYTLYDLIKFGKKNMMKIKGVADAKADLMLGFAREKIESA